MTPKGLDWLKKKKTTPPPKLSFDSAIGKLENLSIIQKRKQKQTNGRILNQIVLIAFHLRCWC